MAATAARLLRGRAGTHTWNNVQPIGGRTTGVDEITGNHTRAWVIETRGARLDTTVWGSGIKGVARVAAVPWRDDGSLNAEYYRRLRRFVAEADERDVVTGVMLFEGAFIRKDNGWDNHPFRGLGPSDAYEVHTKGPWNRFQRDHVRAVVKAVDGYDNVYYEVGNELAAGSVRWFQKAVVSWLRRLTKRPVAVSYASRVKPDQGWIAATGADIAFPAGTTPAPGFRGVDGVDTDHVSPLTSNVAALRDAWAAGRPLLLMHGHDGYVLRNRNSLAADLAFIESVT